MRENVNYRRSVRVIKTIFLICESKIASMFSSKWWLIYATLSYSVLSQGQIFSSVYETVKQKISHLSSQQMHVCKDYSLMIVFTKKQHYHLNGKRSHQHHRTVRKSDFSSSILFFEKEKVPQFIQVKRKMRAVLEEYIPMVLWTIQPIWYNTKICSITIDCCTEILF